MSWDGPIASDFRHGNEVVVEAVVRHPERFLGVAYVNPVYSSRKELLTDLKRYVGELGFAGLKPYCRAGLGYDDERYAPCWEFADAEGLFVLLHTTGTKAGNSAVSGLAEKYPNVQWVIVHAGSSFDFAREVAAIMGNHGNVWAELTYSTVTNGLIEWLAAEVGDERILFGTDAPMRDPRPQFGWVVWADLPAESRLRILGENFRRLTASRRGKE
jgi:predicted TIM-barrel fold metal-dependent hydrolase